MKVTLPLITLISILQSSNAVKINGQRDPLRDEDITARYLQMSMPTDRPTDKPDGDEPKEPMNEIDHSSSSSSSSSKSSSNKSSKGSSSSSSMGRKRL
eukprot:CAMPEP_0198280234 /NCGR_PEP_ID=MMETSP1449-20131203/351_1 /TAXON_ID=420275 /ORGANISM="Attheya septentrionalis, Strain CCMP2084" /LENGTH=97 /DNA_ID=CAMNT_0043975527 /DNA_START=100 /DNA_END=393 /DNA_ORIENTATION=-